MSWNLPKINPVNKIMGKKLVKDKSSHNDAYGKALEEQHDLEDAYDEFEQEIIHIQPKRKFKYKAQFKGQ